MSTNSMEMEEWINSLPDISFTGTGEPNAVIELDWMQMFYNDDVELDLLNTGEVEK